jgi:hypothetical protein
VSRKIQAANRDIICGICGLLAVKTGYQPWERRDVFSAARIRHPRVHGIKGIAATQARG